MAELNLQYDQSTDHYSDGEIEDTLLAFVRGELKEEELYAQDNLYPVLYHLSPQRENILNWYPFCPHARVLEIGSGCGALTGILCQRAETVVSAELSRRRASINCERHKACDNLTIMVGNLNDMQFDEPFDYIVVNGVLEYAMSFTHEEKPYEHFLKGLCRFLKPDGHFLIAIENRLGLKYFNGAPEDHTGHYFEGVDGYPDNDTVRTFSKSELSALLCACGLNEQTFYYPYPDYKFPTEIFTDETICTYGYGGPFVNLDEKRYRLFEERGVWGTLSDEEITAHFANSFLVDAALQPFTLQPEMLYVKLNNDRGDRFRIATSIMRRDGEKTVVKSPLTEAAKQHLTAMYAQSADSPSSRFENLRGTLQPDGSICYPFLKEQSLDHQVGALIAERQTDQMIRLLHHVFDEYGKDAALRSDYQTEAFRQVFGTAKLKTALPCVRPANIDLICDNIFPQKDKYCIIDCEWILDMDIPMPFIIWRSINELYTKHRDLEELIARGRLMLAFDIDEPMSRVFWEWATHFAKTYVASSRLESYTKPMQMFSIDEILRQRMLDRLLCSSLYYDTGSGFNEEQKLYSEVLMRDGQFCVSYDLRNLDLAVRRLRWDPLEGVSCTCRLRKVTGAKAAPYNADMQDGDKEVFLTNDPVYLLEREEGAVQVTLEGSLHKFSASELADYINDRLPILKWQSDSLQETIKKQQTEIERLQGALADEEAAYKQTLNEKTAIEKQHGELIDSFQDLRREYDTAVQELNEIHASKSWRLLNKLKGN